MRIGAEPSHPDLSARKPLSPAEKVSAHMRQAMEQAVLEGRINAEALAQAREYLEKNRGNSFLEERLSHHQEQSAARAALPKMDEATRKFLLVADEIIEPAYQLLKKTTPELFYVDLVIQTINWVQKQIHKPNHTVPKNFEFRPKGDRNSPINSRDDLQSTTRPLNDPETFPGPEK